jgi:hypothetical protein
MGLSSNDKKPTDISLEKAYINIRKWYKNNIDLAIARGDDYGKRSARLIKNLPTVKNINQLEIRAILGEIIYGNLEWAYHKDDGKYKMAAYAHSALETEHFALSLSEEEKDKLKNSRLWPYLSIKR